MKTKRNENAFQRLLIWTIGICVFIVLVCMLITSRTKRLRTYQDYVELKNGWILDENGTTEEISLPHAIHHSTMEPFTLTYTFDEEMDGEDRELFTVAYYCDLNVYLDGQLYDTYAFTKTSSFQTNGSGYLLFKLPEQLSGHTITLEYIPQIKLHTYRIVMPLYGNRGDIIIRLFYQELVDTILNLVLIIFGIFLLIAGLLFKRIGHRSGKLLLGLGFFAGICGTYLEVRMDWLRLILQNPLGIYQTEFLLQLLIMLPIMLMIYSIFYGLSQKLLKCGIIVNVVHVIAQYLLYFLTPLELKSMMIFSHTVLILSIILVTYITFFRKEMLPGYQKEITYSIIPMGFFGALDIILHYVNRTAQTGVLFKVGVIVFLCMEIYFNIRHYREYILEEQQNRIYREIAFKDILTGLKNRNAYEQQLYELEKVKDQYDTIAAGVFDLNQLKQTNDMMGHEMGDKLIRTMADLLKRVSQGRWQVYRTGGDEFIVFFFHLSDNELEKICKSMESEAKYCRVSETMTLSFSYGIAKYESDRHHSIKELIAEADANMYRAKQAYHEKQEQK